MSNIILEGDLVGATPARFSPPGGHRRNWLAEKLVRFAATRRRRRALETLAAHDDWLLQDIGLTRADIEAARKGDGRLRLRDELVPVRFAFLGGDVSWPRNKGA